MELECVRQHWKQQTEQGDLRGEVEHEGAENAFEGELEVVLALEKDQERGEDHLEQQEAQQDQQERDQEVEAQLEHLEVQQAHSAPRPVVGQVQSPPPQNEMLAHHHPHTRAIQRQKRVQEVLNFELKLAFW